MSRNEASVTRLLGALLLEQNDEWQLQRRYLQLEGLQALRDNQPARLSAVRNGADNPASENTLSYTTPRDTTPYCSGLNFFFAILRLLLPG